MSTQKEKLINLKIKAYQDLFNGSQLGQFVLSDLIDQCKLFTTNTTDQHAETILTGKRSIGVYLLQMTGLAPQYGEPFQPKYIGNIINALENAQKLHDIHKSQTKPHTKREEDIDHDGTE